MTSHILGVPRKIWPPPKTRENDSNFFGEGPDPPWYTHWGDSLNKIKFLMNVICEQLERLSMQLYIQLDRNKIDKTTKFVYSTHL